MGVLGVVSVRLVFWFGPGKGLDGDRLAGHLQVLQFVSHLLAGQLYRANVVQVLICMGWLRPLIVGIVSRGLHAECPHDPVLPWHIGSLGSVGLIVQLVQDELIAANLVD